MSARPDRVACFRTDRIGDLILAMPAMAALARALPGGRIIPVVAPRTAELVTGQTWAEEAVCWTPAAGAAALARALRGRRVDAAVFFYPRPAAALGAVLAGVRTRLGPASRWYAPLFTHRVRMHRSENRRHELLYNFDLLAPLGVAAPPEPELIAPVIPAPAEEQARALLQRAGIGDRFVVIHPGSGGSALNAGPERYGEIARAVEDGGGTAVLTGSDPERGLLERVAASAGLSDARLLFPSSLGTLAAVLRRAASVVGPSTGPLHLAAAVGTRTVALFPPLHAQQPVRWRPWGGRGTVLTPHPALCPSCLDSRCPLFNCLERIPAADVARAALES